MKRGWSQPFKIGRRLVGPGQPTYVIAEMSANHNGDYQRAAKIVKAARRAGADAVKIQTYTPDTMTLRSRKPPFIVKGLLWEGKSLYELYEEAATPWTWHAKLQRVADKAGIELFSTAYDATALEFLEKMKAPVHKVASFENVDLPLIEAMARTGKPMILSTGMATLAEITEAVEAVRAAGGRQLALLKCTSQYPAPPDEMNLRTIPHLGQAFGVPVGLSDHTLGAGAAVAAVALGACILEKHFTLSRGDPGPDSAFSMEPDEFKRMVEEVRTVEAALGDVSYAVSDREAQSRVYRRSLFVVKDVRAGESFTPRNLQSIRPGHGLPPRYLPAVLGLRAARDIEAGTPLSWDLVSGVGS